MKRGRKPTWKAGDIAAGFRVLEATEGRSGTMIVYRCLCLACGRESEIRQAQIRHLEKRFAETGGKSAGCYDCRRACDRRRPEVSNPEIVARRTEMVRMRADGKNMQEIGNHYGISRERVRQILNEERARTQGGK